jgi:hypothetical protein
MNQKQKDAIYSFILIAPFSVLLMGLLLGSANCKDSYFCSGYPAFLQHSVFYDFFLLRADFSNGLLVSHWSSELLIAVFPFIVLAITKKADFAFTATFFYAVQHELLWVFVLATMFNTFPEGHAIIWFFGYSIISIYVLRQYRKVFFTKEYLALVISYYGYLFLQAIYWLVSGGYVGESTSGFQFDETGTVSWLVWTILVLILIWRKRKCLS